MTAEREFDVLDLSKWLGIGREDCDIRGKQIDYGKRDFKKLAHAFVEAGKFKFCGVGCQA